MATQILGEAGPSAKPLIPDLLEFAKLPDEAYTYKCVAKIAPEVSSQVPEVAQALKEQQRDQMWSEKWKSGSYTLDDLRAALKEPNQTLVAAKFLADMGAPAKIAMPEMIHAMWGKDEGARDEILADIHKIDPQATVTKIDLNKEPLIDRGLEFAHSALEKTPSSSQTKVLTDTCFQMFFASGWILPDELAALTNSLANQAPKAYQAYLEGLKPPTCSKPADSNTAIFPLGAQSNLNIK